VLYELLSGVRPFTGRTMSEIVLQVINQPPPDIHILRPELTSALVSVVERALSKEPEQRFSAAREMAEALRRATDKTADRTVILSREAGTFGSRTSANAARAVSPALAQLGERELTRHLGPIARILVRRAQQAATSDDDFWRRLSVHIDNASARADFLGRYRG